MHEFHVRVTYTYTDIDAGGRCQSRQLPEVLRPGAQRMAGWLRHRSRELKGLTDIALAVRFV
jgi:hypothetical protein